MAYNDEMQNSASITLRSATLDELEYVEALDNQEDVRRFIIKMGLKQHQKTRKQPLTHYLIIENTCGEKCGYFLLEEEPNSESVEFRRIAIDQNKRGIGQVAIKEMERYCQEHLKAKRIWLDVFDDNAKGIYIYEKLGYQRFKQGTLKERVLYYYEKLL